MTILMSSNKKCKILILFSDMIADILSDKKNQLIVPNIFIRSRKTNIYLVFVTQSYFPEPNKKHQTTLYTLHYNESSKQRRA